MKANARQLMFSLALSLFLNLCIVARGQTTTNEPSSQASKIEDLSPLAPGEFNNWLTIGVGGFSVDGDRAQFQRRQQMPAGAFGGIEDFHWEQSFKKDGLFTIDGRGIFDNHDYLLKLQLQKEKIGYVQFGYREFRTWYDGSGGFFPLGTINWLPLYNDEMHVDRGEIWFEAGLRVPDAPEITFRYSHEFRDGKKDSTSWGDATINGVTANTMRGISPSFWRLDEDRDIFMLDARHTLSKTEVGLGLRYEMVDNDDARLERRRPGEAADRAITQREKFESDMFNAHAYTQTRFNEKVVLTSGYSFTTLDTDVGGSRIYGSDYDAVYDPLFARRQSHDSGFLDLGGGSDVKQYVFNLNLMVLPWETLTLVPSLRIEHQDQTGLATFTETEVGDAPALITTETPVRNDRERDFTDVSEALELRYTGITNWLFYARAEWLEGNGDLEERQRETDPDAPKVTIQRDTDSERFTQKYQVGANWYPLRRLNLAGQYYHKVKQNDYTHFQDATDNSPTSGNRYPAYLIGQDFETDDMNFRITWRPLMNLTLVTRYDFQLSTVDTHAQFLHDVQSTEMTSHIISQNISWAPWNRLYLQGSVNYALDETETGGNHINPTNNVVPTSHNDYWIANAVVGFALDQKTDLQAQYYYYRADNYNRSAAVFTQPFGAGVEEHGVTATLSRQLTRALRLTLRYGFITNRDETSGGHNSYDAHMVSSSLQYRF